MSDMETDQANAEAKGWISIAADMERRLTAAEVENGRLRAALKPLATLTLWRDDYPDSKVDRIINYDMLRAADVTNARSALEQSSSDK